MPSVSSLRHERQKIGRALDLVRAEREKLRDTRQDKKDRDPETDKVERRLDRQIEKLAAEERRLTRSIQDLERRDEGLLERIKRKRRERAERGRVVVQAGAPHWGGADDILRNEVEPVAAKDGLAPNSAKRTESYGNPDSDHHTSQSTASARDFPTAENYGLRDRIARALGISGTISDYTAYYIERAGRTFRVQLIAGTHGTGPHLHVGIRLV